MATGSTTCFIGFNIIAFVQRAAIRFLVVPALLSRLLFGAIAPDTTSISLPYSNSAPVPWSHTMGTCANGFLAVGVGQNTGYNITSATFNGVALKPSISSVNPNTGNAASLWYVVNPPAGAHNITVTLSGNSGAGLGTDWGTAAAVSLCGVDPVSPINATHAASGPTTLHPTNTITPTVAGSYVVELLDVTYNTSATFTAAASWTPAVVPKGGSRAVMTFTGPVAAAATTNLWTLEANYPYADVMLALTPFTGVVAPALLTPTYLTGLEANIPATCPGPGLVFFYATDTGDLFRCFPATGWHSVGDVSTMPTVPPPAVAAVPMAGTLLADGKTCSEAPWLDIAWSSCAKTMPVDSFYKGKTVTGICAVAPPMDCVLQ